MTAGATPPSRQVQAAVISKAEQPLKDSHDWYIISQRWWDLWNEYVRDDVDLSAGTEEASQARGKVSTPPPIDNTHLTLKSTEAVPIDGGPLQEGLVEQRDFHLIHKDAWEPLHSWYGGGPILKRSIINLGGGELQVELFPPQVTVYKVTNMGTVDQNCKGFSVSRRSKLKDLMEHAQRVFSPNEQVPVHDLSMWCRLDPSVDHSQVSENDNAGWLVAGPHSETLENLAVTNGMSLLLEQRVPTRTQQQEWPLWHRWRQEYRKKRYKDPHSPDSAPLCIGDELDATDNLAAQGYGIKKWYPATIVDEDKDKVLVQFQFRPPPQKQMPEITKEKGWSFYSSVELSNETTEALRKVFEYYANLDSDKAHMDKKALASLISCATNTICQQDDPRVANILRQHDSDKDGLITIDDFLSYWHSRASSPSGGNHWLKEELQRLYVRTKVQFGVCTETDKLLQEGKEWIPRNSERLARAKSHVNEYPYIRMDERDFRDFRHQDKLDVKIGKEWFAARVIQVDWNDLSLEIERFPNGSMGSMSSSYSSSSYAPTNYGSPHPSNILRHCAMESDRIAKYQTMSITQGDVDTPSKSVLGAPAAGSSDVPGACGLNNLGNTCFINATLQALSNTVPLRDYYRTGGFKPEVCKCPLSMDGRLADGFAEVLNALWSHQPHKAISPVKLKALVGERRPEFKGYQQHDAQELLTFLLDGLHEDVNRIAYPRPQVEDPKTEGKTDMEIAQEAWLGHLKRNDSRIVEIFQFQIRSEITFPTVGEGEKSLTFDPMMYLSLHVPKPPHSVPVTILPANYPASPAVTRTFQIPRDRPFKDLENLVAEAAGSPTDGSTRILLADLYDNRPYKIFNSNVRVSEVRPTDSVWAFEVPLLPDVPESSIDVASMQLRKRTKIVCSNYSTGFYLQSGSSSSAYSFKRFAPPQIFAYQPGVTTNEEVRRPLMAFARRMLAHFGAGVEQVTLTVIAYGTDEGNPLPANGIFKLTPEEALSLNFIDLEAAGGKENPLPEIVNMDDPSCGGPDVRLEQLLDAFEVREELSKDDWVYCRKTQSFERSLKKLDLWTTPDILVIHLKRFGRERLTGPLEKIDTLVKVPNELDLTPWVKGPKTEQGFRYAFYASVNHAGSLGFGHYTAHALVGNREDESRKWFYFNDSSATPAEESAAVSKASYILFFERIPPKPSS